ncbi:MAG: pentapeptide repeat-containing protein [Gimesia chilikensis]|uniref:pentapeptide repeat-containing protein n=1 Tax=Gimesia chilikensis TaxID=2605989 RepID=UPI0037BA0F05
MATRKELKERWSDDLIESVLAQFRSGKNPAPFGHTESGLCDLRGLMIRGILRNVTMNLIDLTCCSTERGGAFLGCTFNDVDLSNSMLKTNIDGRFSACRFVEANLNGALFRGSFENCSFLKAKLKNSVGESVSFIDCCFDSTDLRGAHLCACSFNTCTWKDVKFGNGSFYRSKFTGEQPNDVGNTIMDHAEYFQEL